MKHLIVRMFAQQKANPCPMSYPRMWLGVVLLATATLQLACTDIRVFSRAAAVATFAATDLPISVPANADFGKIQPSIEARQCRSPWPLAKTA